MQTTGGSRWLQPPLQLGHFDEVARLHARGPSTTR